MDREMNPVPITMPDPLTSRVGAADKAPLTSFAGSRL
jgi:hypothetical protein